MNTKTAETTRKMVECAIMIAFSSVLSVLKLVDMPYGGSVTFASMLPVAIIAYRHGIKWGCGAGLAYATVQQLLGLENFSYLPVPTWQAIVALCVLDYLLAFTVIGFCGIFRDRYKGKNAQAIELALGIGFVSVARYVLHTIAGFTVWAGLLIPDAAALIYSIGYNATYMIPETVVNICVALYVGTVIDLRRSTPIPMARPEKLMKDYSMLAKLGGFTVAVGGVIADACLIFKYMQDPESGAFTFAHLGEVSWLAVGIVTAACALVSAALFAYAYMSEKSSSEA